MKFEVFGNNDIFLIPSARCASYLVYAPLQRCVFTVTQNEATALRSYFCSNVPIPQQHRRLRNNVELLLSKSCVTPTEKLHFSENGAVILLSQICNLGCTYCYARYAHSNEKLTKAQLQVFIDYVLQHNDGPGKKRIAFVGGGEPLCTWDLFAWSVDYIKSIDPDGTVICLTTNATLIDQEKAQWLKTHNITPTVSFDILPDIQNKQRPYPHERLNSFDVVDCSIKSLISCGLIPHIRTTITKDCVVRMPEMISFIADNYPQIKKVHFEQVSEPGLENSGYYDYFVKYFFQARSLANKYGIAVRNSLVDAVRYTRSRFCAGEVCLAPSGSLVACHRVSSDNDSLFSKFEYGQVTNEIYIENPKSERVLSMFRDKKNQCESCFARWNCSGGCTYNRESFSEPQALAYCDFTQKMIRGELETLLYVE